MQVHNFQVAELNNIDLELTQIIYLKKETKDAKLAEDAACKVKPEANKLANVVVVWVELAADFYKVKDELANLKVSAQAAVGEQDCLVFENAELKKAKDDLQK